MIGVTDDLTHPGHLMYPPSVPPLCTPPTRSPPHPPNHHVGASTAEIVDFLLRPQSAALRPWIANEIVVGVDLFLRDRIRKAFALFEANLTPRLPFPFSLVTDALGGGGGGGGGGGNGANSNPSNMSSRPPLPLFVPGRGITDAREIVDLALPPLTPQVTLSLLFSLSLSLLFFLILSYSLSLSRLFSLSCSLCLSLSLSSNGPATPDPLTQTHTLVIAPSPEPSLCQPTPSPRTRSTSKVSPVWRRR